MRLALIQDPDDEVRLSTMKAQRKLVEKVKKKLAPFLKQLIWPWLVVLHDDSRTVKAAAREAFDAAFPKHKQPEVLNFCREEIFANVSDILFAPGTNPLNELMPKPQSNKPASWRAVNGCLQTLQMLAEHLGENESFDQYIEQLLQQKQFWNYSNHANDCIRAGWFNLFTALAIHRPHLIKLHLTPLSKITFNSVSQKSIPQGTARGAIWQNIVTIVQSFEDCFQGINMEKSFLPHLFKELESCSRDAFDLFANLKQMLFKLSANLENSFIENFFASFVSGLCNSIIINTDFELLFESFFDTMESILQNPNDYKCDQSFAENLLMKNLPKLLVSRFSDSYVKVQAIFFYRLAQFVQHLPSESNMPSIVARCLSQALNQLFAVDDAKFRNLNICLSILFHHQAYYERWTLKPFPPPLDFKPNIVDIVSLSQQAMPKFIPILKELKTFFVNLSTISFKDYGYWIFVKRFIDICYQVDLDLLSKEDETTLESNIFNLLSSQPNLTKNEKTWMISVVLSMAIHGSYLNADSITRLLKITSHTVVTLTLDQLLNIDSPKVVDYIRNGLDNCPTFFIQNYLEKELTKANGTTEQEAADEVAYQTLLSSLFNLLSQHGQSHVLLNAIRFGSAKRRRQLAVFLLKKIQPGPKSNSLLLDKAIESLFQQCFHEETPQSDESILQLLPILLQLSPEDDFWPVLEHLGNMIRTDLQQLNQHSLVCRKIEQLLAQVLQQDQILCLRLLKTILPTNQSFDYFQSKLVWHLWLKELITKPDLQTEDLEQVSLDLPPEMFICHMQLRLLNFMFEHNPHLIHNPAFVEIFNQQLQPICQSVGYASVLDELHALKIHDALHQDLPERLKLLEDISQQLKRLSGFLPKKQL